jgi:hypothetical protein
MTTTTLSVGHITQSLCSHNPIQLADARTNKTRRKKIRLAQATLFLRLAEYSSMGTQGEAPHRRRQSAFSAAQLCIRGSAVRWQRAAETGQRKHPPHSAPILSSVLSPPVKKNASFRGKCRCVHAFERFAPSIIFATAARTVGLRVSRCRYSRGSGARI